MNEENKANVANEETNFSRQVGAQAARKLKAQRGATRSVWFGLGMSGLIGWSVTVPTLIGAALGIWVDNHYPSRFSSARALPRGDFVHAPYGGEELGEQRSDDPANTGCRSARLFPDLPMPCEVGNRPAPGSWRGGSERATTALRLHQAAETPRRDRARRRSSKVITDVIG